MLIQLRRYNSALVSTLKIMYSLTGIPEWYGKVVQLQPKVYWRAQVLAKPADSSNSTLPAQGDSQQSKGPIDA